jgi:hypothetical protein
MAEPRWMARYRHQAARVNVVSSLAKSVLAIPPIPFVFVSGLSAR